MDSKLLLSNILKCPTIDEVRCKTFLDYQRQELAYLQQLRNIHLRERGKLDYGLILEDQQQVSFASLNQKFESFAYDAHNFVQYLTRLCNNSGNVRNLKIAQELREKALEIVTDFLKKCVVLKKQPVCVNYEKKKNETPTLICMGVNHLSGLNIVGPKVTLVKQNDLYNAVCNGTPLEDVKAVSGFNVVAETSSSKSKNSKSKSGKDQTKHDKHWVTINLGNWHMANKKDLGSSEKGSTHKAFLRMRFSLSFGYEGKSQPVMLLSHPFNIRTGSSQFFTFIGSLMWYFYTTEDPYQKFEIVNSLTVEDAVKMLVTRIENIGRKISDVARQFFHDRLHRLSCNGDVELETLARGPPTNKEDQAHESNDTRTVDETINLYGFFTWFYALIRSLDESGYLHTLWIKGYIYDLCSKDHIDEIIMDPTFGLQTIIIRPSFSSIDNYQGELIHMGLASFFKYVDKHKSGEEMNIAPVPRVVSVRNTKQEVESCGVYKCISCGLLIEFIFRQDGVCSFMDLKDKLNDVPPVKEYYGNKFSVVSGVQLELNGEMIKHCSTCRCANAQLNIEPDSQSQTKKVRGSSPGSTSQLADDESLKRRISDSSTVSQVESPAQFPSTSQSVNLVSSFGSPSQVTTTVSDGNCQATLPDFASMLHLQSPRITTTDDAQSRERLDLISNFQQLAETVCSTFSNDEIKTAIDYITCLKEEKNNLDSSPVNANERLINFYQKLADETENEDQMSSYTNEQSSPYSSMSPEFQPVAIQEMNSLNHQGQQFWSEGSTFFYNNGIQNGQGFIENGKSRGYNDRDIDEITDFTDFLNVPFNNLFESTKTTSY